MRRIICLSQAQTGCPSEVVEKLKFLEGKSIFSVGDSPLHIQEYEFDIVSIKVALPNTATVTITLPHTVAQLVTNDATSTGSGRFLVNEKGTITPITTTSTLQLPTIITHQLLPTRLGYKLKSAEVLAAIALLSYLEPSTKKTISISTSPGQMEISGLSDFTFLASTLKDPIETATTLQQVLKSPTINRLTPKSVDIRFSQPVVIFQ